MNFGAVVATPEKTNDTTKNVAYSKGDTSLKLDDGYMGDEWGGTLRGLGWTDSFVEVTIAGASFNGGSVKGVTGSIPIGISGWSGPAIVTVEVYAVPTEEAISKWQLQTFAKIVTAYEAALDEYRRGQASSNTSGGLLSYGNNPDSNRKIEQAELKRASIRLLTRNFEKIKVAGIWRTHEVFDAMKPEVNGKFVDFDLDEAAIEGRIIQFFEQAFEWENMAYRFYPYFWARAETWIDALSATDRDPKFADFLSAGASRVVVPVHPQYTDAILHYLASREVWLGGEPPTLDDPLYISIAAEVRAQGEYLPHDKLPHCEEGVSPPCIVDEWDVRVPTELVYLQANSDLPWQTLRITYAELQAILDLKAKKVGGKLEWRHSVVDLLKTLSRPSRLEERKELAVKLGYPEEDIVSKGTAKMNRWLHARLIQLLLENGGELPD